jgi:hypothetical protein
MRTLFKQTELHVSTAAAHICPCDGVDLGWCVAGKGYGRAEWRRDVTPPGTPSYNCDFGNQ